MLKFGSNVSTNKKDNESVLAVGLTRVYSTLQRKQLSCQRSEILEIERRAKFAVGTNNNTKRTCKVCARSDVDFGIPVRTFMEKYTCNKLRWWVRPTVTHRTNLLQLFSALALLVLLKGNGTPPSDGS